MCFNYQALNFPESILFNIKLTATLHQRHITLCDSCLNDIQERIQNNRVLVNSSRPAWDILVLTIYLFMLINCISR